MSNELRHWMRLVEGESNLPKGFTDDEDGTVAFTCQFGSGGIMANFPKRSCAIYNFQSDGQKGRGNGRKTLQWLRKYFDEIDVIDPGEEESDSRLFWEKMRAEGLVAGLYDENERPL